MHAGRIIKRTLFVAAASYLGICAALYVMQRSFLYHPTTGAIGPPSDYDLSGYTAASATTDDGLNLLVWHRPADAGMPTVILFHGNAGNLGYRARLLRALGSAGFGVVALEYRGYGPNPGSPSEDGLYRDARAALAFAVSVGVQPDRVILYGESLGSGVAVQIATECTCAALALQSPFTSMTDMVRWHMPFVPAGLLLSDRFDSAAKLAEVHEALLVFHGEADNVVPIEQGRNLFAQASEPKDALWISGRGHNDMPAAEIASKLVAFTAANRLANAP